MTEDILCPKCGVKVGYRNDVVSHIINNPIHHAGCTLNEHDRMPLGRLYA